MSSKPLILEGIAGDPHSDHSAIQQLRKEKQRLEEEVLGLRREVDDVNRQKEQMERTLRNLRGQLSPLHRALRAVFGEIELAVGEEEATQTPSPGAPQTNSLDPRWESYKQNFPGSPARVIDALLTHKEMSIQQLSKLLRMDYSTAKVAVSKLKAAGAIRKEGKGPASLNV